MRHGTNTAYITHGCRCMECSRARARHQKRYRLDRARGVARLVDAEPLRQHVEMLMDAGMSSWDITLAAGWKSRNALADALTRKRVRPQTMQRILAVKPQSDRRNRYVDATGSRRRLQALAINGWPYRILTERVGDMDPQTIGHIMSGRTRTIRAWTADAVANLYDELWSVPGPSRKSTTIATRKGWMPALAWDDDTIDDPNAEPHGAGWTPRARDRAALVEDFIEMRRNGTTFAGCAMRLGMTEQSLERALYRAKADGIEIPDFNKENAA